MGLGKIDLNLEEAWHRLSARCRADRIEAARRASRRLRAELQRPPRAWCLCLRASDTRIRNRAIILPNDDETYPPIDNVESLVDLGLPHTVVLDGPAIRSLTMPVHLPWPGVDWMIAANRLGMHCETLRSWIKRGTLEVERFNAFSCSKRGKPVPIVWAQSPLDPNAVMGRAPDPVWGTLWQWLHERMPDDHQLQVRRIAREAPYDAKRWDAGECHDMRTRGWSFICPGRLRLRTGVPLQAQDDPDSFELVPCGRKVRRLYGPQSIWSLPRAMGDDVGFDVGEFAANSSRASLSPTHTVFPSPVQSPCLAGQWHPITTDSSTATGPRTFACHHCWRIRYFSLTSRNGWNHFVTHLSGGLLYGRDVPRPMSEAPATRKRAYRPIINGRPPRRRLQVLELLLRGWPSRKIAERMGIKLGTVNAHIKALFRQHRVHSRAALAAKLGRTLPARPSCTPRVAARRMKVERLRRRGLAYREIARKLGLTLDVVYHDADALNRERKRMQLRFVAAPKCFLTLQSK